MSLNIQNKDFLQGLSCAPFHGLPGPPESTGHSGRRPWLYSLTHMGLVYAEQAGPCRLPLLPPVAGDSLCRQDLLLCLADGGYPDLGLMLLSANTCRGFCLPTNGKAVPKGGAFSWGPERVFPLSRCVMRLDQVGIKPVPSPSVSSHWKDAIVG